MVDLLFVYVDRGADSTCASAIQLDQWTGKELCRNVMTERLAFAAILAGLAIATFALTLRWTPKRALAQGLFKVGVVGL